MRFSHFFLVILFSFIIISCTQNQGKISNEQKEQIEDARNNIEYLNKQAETDTSFKNSSEYAKQMERENIAMAKSMKDLTSNQKNLLQYEIALKELNQYAIRYKNDPSLIQNKEFAAQFQKSGNSVRELYQLIIASKLNSDEKEFFDNLNNKK